MQVTLDEVWALAKEHARSDGTELPTIDQDTDHARNSMIEGMEVKFHIDNSPAVYYTVGGIDDLVYVDCQEARQSDEMTGPYVDREEFKNRVSDFAYGASYE